MEVPGWSTKRRVKPDPELPTMALLSAVVLAGWFCSNVLVAMGDVGTATSYDPPYLPTTCPGYDKDNFPEGGLFAAAGDGVWDNGAACGRRYQVRCLSGRKRPCKEAMIVVEIVDKCRSACGNTLLLSTTAFNEVSKNPNTKINIEFAQF